MFGFQHVSS